MNRTMKAVMAGGAMSYLSLQWLGRTWGSTRAERRRVLPGDEIVSSPSILTTHATTIDSPPSAVWPWLIQMGWHQGGWYTKRWVDRLLFPANWEAADRLMPEYRSRRVGDFIPDGPPESKCGFTIERVEPERCLVLHSTSHLPLSWRDRIGAGIDWTWVFVLDDVGAGRSRLIFRCRGVATPWWLRAAFKTIIIPADFVMSRQMLTGIKERVGRQRVRDQVATLASGIRHGDRATAAS